VEQPHILNWPDEFPWFLGKNDILKELYAGDTFRSDQWSRKIIAAVRISPDPLAARAIEEVRLTIENLKPTKVDAKGVPFSEVGLPIAAIRLRTDGADWVEHGNCPQD
jgi:hypothetical protein